MFRFRTIFPDGTPLIAMARILALPGTPFYDASARYTWNPAGPARAKRFIDAARAA